MVLEYQLSIYYGQTFCLLVSEIGNLFHDSSDHVIVDGVFVQSSLQASFKVQLVFQCVPFGFLYEQLLTLNAISMIILSHSLLAFLLRRNQSEFVI